MECALNKYTLLLLLSLGDMLHCSISPIEFVRILFHYYYYYYYFFFLYEFWTVISQEHNQQSCWNFYSIFVIIRNRPVKLFSVITQPWRHPGAILCFDVIIDIFISVYHKLTKFNTHKLQVIWQHTDNPCPRAPSRRARARASKS